MPQYTAYVQERLTFVALARMPIKATDAGALPSAASSTGLPADASSAAVMNFCGLAHSARGDDPGVPKVIFTFISAVCSGRPEIARGKAAGDGTVDVRCCRQLVGADAAPQAARSGANLTTCGKQG